MSNSLVLFIIKNHALNKERPELNNPELDIKSIAYKEREYLVFILLLAFLLLFILIIMLFLLPAEYHIKSNKNYSINPTAS